MNYIRHLAGFFDRVAKDDRLGPLHISMYVSLFQFWNASRFKNPISISRSELMRVSKICSKATYHKCIKELNEYGYLHYQPSYNPIRGSLVYLFNFETGNEPLDELLDERRHTKDETASGQVEEPYINNINTINNKQIKQRAQANTSSNFDEANTEEKKPVGRKSKPGGAPMPVPNSIEEVHTFFQEEKSTKHEAEIFYNYFQSTGWKVGGRAPMKDWQAAARNWLLNSQKLEMKKQVLPSHLNSKRLWRTTLTRIQH